jgi:L-threonylcarbamoyladenylate synthase
MAEIGKDIALAAKLLSEGSLVSIPTETVYGLAGNALDEDAILGIFKAKDRPKFDPLIAHVPSSDKASALVKEIPPVLQAIMDDLWPGPLTVLLEKSDKVSDLLTSGSSRVAIRVPSHATAKVLLEAIDFPLAAPSANPFGYVSPTTAQHVEDQLGERVSYILDGGPCQIGVESTIIGMEGDQLTVYRLGGTPLEQLEKYGEFSKFLNQSSNPQAPGMIKSHYAPKKKLVIGDIRQNITEHQDGKIGVISYSEEYPEADVNYVLSRNGSLDEAAKHLFDALRSMDKADAQVIYTEWMPDKGLGRAINDRLQRAAVR